MSHRSKRRLTPAQRQAAEIEAAGNFYSDVGHRLLTMPKVQRLNSLLMDSSDRMIAVMALDPRDLGEDAAEIWHSGTLLLLIAQSEKMPASEEHLALYMLRQHFLAQLEMMRRQAWSGSSVTPKTCLKTIA
jgi:hypothetical protein